MEALIKDLKRKYYRYKSDEKGFKTKKPLIEDKIKNMKRIDEWKGLVYIRGEQTNIHIQIFKPKKINYYIHIDTIKHSILSRLKDVPFKEVFGPLISVVKKRIKG